jgi:hypothetical protein
MRLLVNYTRASDPKTPGSDEVYTYWIKSKNKYDSFLHKKSHEGERHVIVIHPSHENDEVQSGIVDIVDKNSFNKVGVLYHNPEKRSDIEEKLRSYLPEADYSFFENYSTNASDKDDYDTFYVPLAEACRDGDDFSEEFDALWNHYSPAESLEIKLNLLHELLVPPATEDKIIDMGESLIEGVKNDPEASDENATRCEQAWENFRKEDPQQYSDDPFNEKYCGSEDEDSEDEEGILEELRDKLLATAS